MNRELIKYAALYSALDVIGEGDTGASFIIKSEDMEGAKLLARLVAARLCGLDESRAFDEHTDITVYPLPIDEKKPKGKKAAKTAEAKKPVVSVDDIRNIIASLYLTPFELDKRVFIIEEADSMSEACQNTLLKSLEEPPARVCFILCASTSMLPTVESRCRTLILPPFPIPTVEEQLYKYHSDREAVRLAARASRGNFGMAESILADAEFGANYGVALKILCSAQGSRDFGRTAAIYEKFTRERTASVLGLMEYMLSDIARSLSGAETVFAKSDIDRISVGFTPLCAARCAEYARVAARHNAGKCMQQAVLDELILKIMEEKALCRR